MSEDQGRATYLDVRGHFDRMAQGYDDGCVKVAWSGPQILVGELARFPFAAQKSLKVVDLGTGTGLVGMLLKEQLPDTHVTGIDMSGSMIEVALKHGRIDEGLVGGIEVLRSLDSQSAHVITASGVMDFIPDAKPFVEEFARILAMGGYFALTYEPTGTAQDGVKSLQHDPGILRAAFEQYGCAVLLDQEYSGAYTNFKTGRPVTNHVLVGLRESRP